jgi:demethylmenaquinone methyltransferase / 2-methoxy-6-polyprenyl-1,4-benzoquinol methylase
MNGAKPAGTRSEEEAAQWVRGMFAQVAHRYDLANHLLSFNIDRHWRAHTARRVRHILERPGARALDICCGTGDLALAVAKELAQASACGGAMDRSPERGSLVFASDFCHPMLAAARAKAKRLWSRTAFFEADALRLPVRDASLDLITVGFGFRNLANYSAGLAEMRRALRSGGVAAILEFSQPRNPAFAALYGFYSRRVLPLVGGALSGSRDAYAYLPDSVRKFPSAGELAEAMRCADFRDVTYEFLTGGIVALHRGSA